MTTPPSVHDTWLSPHVSVGALPSGTVRIVCDHEELHLLWPRDMSPADKAAKCAAIAAVFTEQGLRYVAQDVALVPAQRVPEDRGPLNTPPVPAPRKNGGD